MDINTESRQFTSGGLGRLQILELPLCRQRSREGDENKQSPTTHTLSQISPSPENSAPQQPNNKCKDSRTNYCPYYREPLAPYRHQQLSAHVCGIFFFGPPDRLDDRPVADETHQTGRRQFQHAAHAGGRRVASVAS